jgi:hypothetical protein
MHLIGLRFKNTLQAVKQAGITQGGIGDALRADIIADIEGADNRSMSQFEDCETFLSLNGHEFDATYLRALYRAVAPTARERH